VAEAIEWNDILEDLEQLQQTILPRIEGKLTSKKVVKWLKNWHLHGESVSYLLINYLFIVININNNNNNNDAILLDITYIIKTFD
jgi:hypothetical protein